MGKTLIIIGIVLIIIGAIIHFGIKIPLLGKLPGDIHIKKENYSFYFPIMTSVVLSILLSVIFYIIRKLNG